MRTSLIYYAFLALFSRSHGWILTLYSDEETACVSGGQTIQGDATTGCNGIEDQAAVAFEFDTEGDGETFLTMCTTPADEGCTSADACEVFGDEACFAGGPWSSFQVVVA